MKRIYLFSALLTITALASNYRAPVTYSATTTSGLALAASPYRDYLIIVNNGATSIHVKTDSAHTGTEGVTIPAAGSWEPVKAPIGSIYIRSASGTDGVTLVEGVQ